MIKTIKFIAENADLILLLIIVAALFSELYFRYTERSDKSEFRNSHEKN